MFGWLSRPISPKKLSKPLSYPSLRCILEHVEAIKRMRISIRCPSLRKTERATPLHLDYLFFGDWKFSLNDLKFHLETITSVTDNDRFHSPDEFHDWDEELKWPGDILLKIENEEWNKEAETNRAWKAEWEDQRQTTDYIQLTFRTGSGQIQRRRLPEHLEIYDFHVAVKQLTYFLFKGRRDIRVKKLRINIFEQRVFRLPLGLKFRIRKLKTNGESMDSIVQIIDSSSFPLEELIFCFDKNYSQLPIVRTTKKLTIDGSSSDVDSVASWSTVLINLPNEYIYLRKAETTIEEQLKIVGRLKESGRKIGTCWMVESYMEEIETVLVPELKKLFNGVSVNLMESNDESPTGTQCVCIPINSTSELIILGIEKDLIFRDAIIRMEIMPIGSAKSVERLKYLAMSWTPEKDEEQDWGMEPSPKQPPKNDDNKTYSESDWIEFTVLFFVSFFVFSFLVLCFFILSS